MKKEAFINRLNEELQLHRHFVSPQGLVAYEITDRVGVKLKIRLTAQESLTNPFFFCESIARQVAQVGGLEEFLTLEATCEMPFGTCTFEVPLRPVPAAKVAWPKYGVAS